MAEWEHKDRYWSELGMQMADGKRYSVRELKKAGVTNTSDFSAWLDMQCKDGWEVIKIARDFSADSVKDQYGDSVFYNSTWCVFRRKLE